MLDLKYEEDIEKAMVIVEEVLGKQGRMLPSGATVLYNIKLCGPTNAILWYGDIDTEVDSLRISNLATKLGYGLVAYTENCGMDQLYPIMTGFVI